MTAPGLEIVKINFDSDSELCTNFVIIHKIILQILHMKFVVKCFT